MQLCYSGCSIQFVLQELVAYGVCNTACSFLNCFSTCFSLSRSCVQEGAGGGTQVVGLVSSILILIVLVFLAPLFQPLPTVHDIA